MDKSLLALRIKELRTQKGMSQEFLAEESGLSLRTIQRVENGESNPTGDSLKRLANALQVTPDELIDWTIKEDNKYLIFLNLSALCFLFFPLLGIILPFIMWTSKKGKIKNIDNLSRALVNYEITWTILMFFIPILLFISSKLGWTNSLSLRTLSMYIIFMFGFNIILILLNTFRISNNKKVVYFPQIKFLK